MTEQAERFLDAGWRRISRAESPALTWKQPFGRWRLEFGVKEVLQMPVAPTKREGRLSCAELHRLRWAGSAWEGRSPHKRTLMASGTS